jgi:MFS family permease
MDVYIKVKSKRTKFILSFISSIVYLLGYSIIMESGNFSVYFISYIHYKQEWVDMQFGNLMRPIIILFLSVFSPLSGIMENLVGPRLALLSSAIVIEIALIFFFIQRNLWIFYVLSLILGLGCGLSAQIVVKNCCLYYPKKKGFISACIMSLGALIGSSYTLLGEKIINPDR